ncbi:restriction endonuclease subunit S [Elizabethkingia occulta]|uniref:restriction endonuclease subunit S n=1 Tax=Elizabethkingia occulta TaxID=1867263 RepID=UPI00099AE9C4|nr:restriction endonuclease subunit S [Elizabethkingia occulta]OPB98014.1 hypothetical protein BB020_14425 [Elizabethkingia occulta]
MKKQKLSELVENFSVRAKNIGGAESLEFYGVSNQDGITKSKYAAEDKAEDYKIIEKGCFAYNPYRVNIGSIAYVNEDIKGLISPAYVIFKTKPNKIDDRLLLKFLKSAEGLRQIKLHARGSVRQALRYEDLCKIEISIPPFNEQVLLLNRIENIDIKSNKISDEITHQLDLIKDLRQAFLREAMQGLLVSNETSDGKTGADLLAEIQAEKAQLIKEKKIKKGKLTKNTKFVSTLNIPHNWTFTKLDELFFVTKLAGFEYTDHMTLRQAGEIPVIRAQNVRNINIEKTNLLFIDIETSLKLNRCALVKECLLITFIGAGIGDVSTFNEKERWHLAPNVAKAEPYEGIEKNYNVKYFNYYLISEFGKFEIKKHMKATAQPSLSMETIRDIDIPLPPLELQQRIVTKLDELMAFCDQLEEQIKRSQQTNDLLLQQVLREALGEKKEEKGEFTELQLVAEPTEQYITKQFTAKTCDKNDMAVLTGYIIQELNTKDFGRVKLQKMLHLVEYHCQLETNFNYYKKVAGPHAEELKESIEPILQRNRFFDIKKEKLGNKEKVNYTALAGASQINKFFNSDFKEQKENIDFVLHKFRNKTWEFCEMISTMYAVWNNRLIKQQSITNDDFKKDFLGWDKEKIKFVDQLDYAIEWIKKENMEPKGLGKYIDRPQTK